MRNVRGSLDEFGTIHEHHDPGPPGESRQGRRVHARTRVDTLVRIVIEVTGKYRGRALSTLVLGCI